MLKRIILIILFNLQLISTVANSQVPLISANGETLSTKNYNIIKNQSSKYTQNEKLPENMASVISEWGDEVRLTYIIDEDSLGKIDGLEAASFGDTVAISYYIRHSGTPTPSPESQIILSQDFGSNWIDTISFSTPGNIISYVDGIRITPDKLIIAGTTHRYNAQTYSPFYLSRNGFSGTWDNPHYFLTNDIYFMKGPQIALSNDTVHFVFWQWDKVDNYPIEIDSFYYFRGEQFGGIWHSGTPLAYVPGASQCPFSLISCGSVINLIYEDYASSRNHTNEIYQIYSTDSGGTWAKRMLSSDDSIHSQLPAAYSNSNGKVVITWMDYKYGSGSSGFTGDILSLVSTDSGINWGPEERVTFDSMATISAPFIADCLTSAESGQIRVRN